MKCICFTYPAYFVMHLSKMTSCGLWLHCMDAWYLLDKYTCMYMSSICSHKYIMLLYAYAEMPVCKHMYACVCGWVWHPSDLNHYAHLCRSVYHRAGGLVRRQLVAFDPRSEWLDLSAHRLRPHFTGKSDSLPSFTSCTPSTDRETQPHCVCLIFHTCYTCHWAFSSYCLFSSTDRDMELNFR